MFPVDGVWATKSEGFGLIVRAISFQDFQPMCLWSWSTNVTFRRRDRRTDGRTTCSLNTALYTVVHRAVKSLDISSLYLVHYILGHSVDGWSIRQLLSTCRMSHHPALASGAVTLRAQKSHYNR